MGYEARIDARNEYNAEIRREALDSGDFDEHVADAIGSGDFDAEVLERAIEIVRDLGVGDLAIVRSLKQILDDASQDSAPSVRDEA